LKGTYFSPAVGIMGFWGDIDRLLAPRTAKRLLGEHCDTTERVAATDGWMRRTTSDPQGPREARSGGSANKSKRRQSQHGRHNRAPTAGGNCPKPLPLRGGCEGGGPVRGGRASASGS